MLNQVPEFYDGGYWYVVSVKVVRDTKVPAITPPEWTAVYGQFDGVDYALIRSPQPWASAPAAGVTADQLIPAAVAAGYLPQGFTAKPVMRNASEL